MSFMPHGKHLIAGEWIGTEQVFQSEPAYGDAHPFSVGTPELIDQAVQAAEEAFWRYSQTSRAERAAFLNAIADEIENRAEAIISIGNQESGLPEARLKGECGRTTGQLRLFSSLILAGDYLDRRHDEALPDRQPLPRPDLRMMQRPIGPVAVFGASNFPLAFSTAGGDTASALAAGCPVVVKGHGAHPGTSEIVAEAILSAIEKCGLAKGVFSLVQGGNRAVGQALVQHPLIKAVGFTGSLGGGRALFDLCAQRSEPIPFFGELGSVNPMFMLPEAISARGTALGQGWAASLSLGAGQFCTNPGIAVVVAGSEAEAFIEAARFSLSECGAQVMLTDGIAAAYNAGAEKMGLEKGVDNLLTSTFYSREAKPFLFKVAAKDWLENHSLSEEVFGPLGLVVVANDVEEMYRVARSLDGQLTATIHMEDGDTALARRLLPVLERKAGRVLANGFPTGVEVCDSMVHGGPYPASTNFGATSVGTMAIRRFLRPVCYQDIPVELLPQDLAEV
ncbi:aldehyde dehydrogenase (NADP(+)) [Vreelandella aquamarina]|uniref:aldehyde dehydrogenase (NADP(+)) n=1 Tax=Vreelandella aquamarina TaxID=77097 RepID=UPI001D17EE84|nr:aldehyde dehydrogenase (NADP(+)) [Halomonas meridiana]MCC4289287.1 aldehyde dehydrogenase (NADP(+)) [Halomonas meridiana]